ncbi:hypothetical protein [Streptococcus suis]
MVKQQQKTKRIGDQLLYTPSYLQEQLLLSSDRQARNILSGYESVEGKSPKLYTQAVMEQAISDWKKKPNNLKKLLDRKEEWEKVRAEKEKKFYEEFVKSYDDQGNHPMVLPPSKVGSVLEARVRFDNELQLMMIKNLYTALGIGFDYQRFFEDLEIDSEYNNQLRIGNIELGNERPVRVVEAQDRLYSDDGYLINK